MEKEKRKKCSQMKTFQIKKVFYLSSILTPTWAIYLAFFCLWIFPSILWIQESAWFFQLDSQSIFQTLLIYMHAPKVHHFFSSILHLLFRVFLFNPIRFIYLNGPSLGGFGFWNGQDLPDICNQLSKGVGTVKFWTKNFDQCELEIEKQVIALCILVWFLVFLFSCYLAIKVALWKYYQHMILKPILTDIYTSTWNLNPNSNLNCVK